MTKLQEDLAREKAQQEALFHRRQTVEETLRDKFGAAWREVIGNTERKDGSETLNRKLKPFGTNRLEVKRLFPEAFTRGSPQPPPDDETTEDERTWLERLRDWWRGA